VRAKLSDFGARWSKKMEKLTNKEQRKECMKKIMLFFLTCLMAGALVLTGCPNDNGNSETYGLYMIMVKDPPTQYIINEDLNTEDMVVVGFYHHDINYCQTIRGYTVSGYNKAKTGYQTITVSYEGHTASFTIYVSDPDKPTVAAPMVSPAAGEVTGSTTVTLTTATYGAEIWYTVTDDTAYNCYSSPVQGESTRYEGPFTITTPVTVKAIAVKDGMNDSAVLETAYIVNPTPLTVNTWTDGNLPTWKYKQWFKFTANANTQYIHFSRGNSGDSYPYIQVYDSNGTPVGGETYRYNGVYHHGVIEAISLSVTAGQEYYLNPYRE